MASGAGIHRLLLSVGRLLGVPAGSIIHPRMRNALRGFFAPSIIFREEIR